jgi:hypothetical protein
MSWKKALPAVATVASVVAGGWAMVLSGAGDTDPPAVSTAAAPTSPRASAGSAAPGAVAAAITSAAPTASPATPPAPATTPAPGAPTLALTPPAQASLQQMQRLGQLPPGDAAVALAQQLEAGISPDNAAGYVQALFSTTSPAAERAAIAALARSGDSGVMQTLAAHYGNLAPEQRGRVLQVFENAANPEALQGLTEVFAADRSEKRSALAMSALVGVAHIGTMESVQVLLSQITPANADYAFVALDRVSSPQGVEMIKGAASGSKDASGIPARYLPALKRLAETRSPS